MSSPHKIQSPEHALQAGFVWGLAMQHGLDVVPELDDEGNYSASVLLEIPDLNPNVTVRLIVAPPEEQP